MRRQAGGGSVAVAKPGRELGGREDRKVACQDEQALVASHQIRAPVDGESQWVVVLGVPGANDRGAMMILGEEDVMQSTPVLDSAGRRRSPAPMPSFREGRAPKNEDSRGLGGAGERLELLGVEGPDDPLVSGMPPPPA